jgi:glycogen debranching enzyme
MTESGLVANEDLKRYVEIFATCGQNGEKMIKLKNGLCIPPFAVADHINYDGGAVYYPGTCSSGDDQGTGRLGFFPPFCDNFHFVLLVHQYVKQTGDTPILNKIYNGIPLMKRLEKAFECYNIDSETGLCVSELEKHTVDWGFVDTIKKSGKLLFSSILRYNAAKALTSMFEMLEIGEKSDSYKTEAEKIKSSIINTFYDRESGWFYSATEVGHQFDVWGTAYAVFSGISCEKKTLEALYAAYCNKTAVVNGQVRHILTTDNFATESAWEYALPECNEYGTYQNGAYWATPTGWYAYALYLYNGKIEILEDFIAHFEKYESKGAPFEWIDEKTERFSGLHYGTSGVLPYIAYKRISEEKTR